VAKEAEVEKALQAGLQLLVHQQEHRKRVREQSKKVHGDLLDAHLLAVSAIANATSEVSGKPGKIDADLSLALSLIASFVQGIDICETAISEGLYVSAAAVLKQQMETIAAIREVQNKTRRSGSTPNVKTFGELAVLYGDLNSLAHVGQSELMQRLVRLELSEQQSGAPLFPVFNAELSKLFYGLHVCFITMIALEVGVTLQGLYGAGLNEIEDNMLVGAARILQKRGWLPPLTKKDDKASMPNSGSTE
jgi:hypothetical protein